MGRASSGETLPAGLGPVLAESLPAGWLNSWMEDARSGTPGSAHAQVMGSSPMEDVQEATNG